MKPDREFPGRRFRLGDTMADPAGRTITGKSGPRRVSLKAMRVLTALAAAAGEVVTRDDLMDRVWPEVTVGEEVLTQAIAELRRALCDMARAPRCIATVHKSGYRLLLSARACDAVEPAPDLPTLLRAQVQGFDLSAYALHLQSCRAFDRGGSINIFAAAQGFGEVIGAQPGFAPAYAGLARSLAFIDMYYGPRGDHLAQALEACEAGLRVNPHSHEVLAAQGTAFSAAGDGERAFASFAAALRRRPDCGSTHYLLGRALFAEGQFHSAAVMQEHAAQLNPDDFHSLLLAAKSRRRIGDERGAHADLVRAEQRIDQHLLAYHDDFRALCDKACCLIELGQKDVALDCSAPLLQHSDPMGYYLVCFLARAGEVPQAIEILEEVVEAGWSHTAVLNNDPDIDPLRGEVRFRRVEQRLQAG